MNYYLYGTDQGQIEDHLHSILSSFTEEERANLTVIDGQDADFTVEGLLEAVNTVSLFDMDNKIVIVKNPSFLSLRKRGRGNKGEKDESFEMLERYLSDAAYFSTVIFLSFEDVYPVDRKSSRYHALLLKKCSCKDFRNMDDKDFALYVRKDLKKRQIDIDPKAVDELISRLDGSVNSYRKEAEKLEIYNERISAEDVRHLVHRSVEDNGLEMCNAVMKKDLKRALRIYYDMVELKSEPKEIIGLLSFNFRRFFQVVTLSETMNREEIAAELGVRNPNSLYYVLEGKKYFSADRALALLSELSALDHQIKLSQIDPYVGMELFLYRATR